MNDQFSYFFRLSAVLEAMPDSLVIIDQSARIVLINKQTEIMFGYERTELLGEHIEQLMPERYRTRHQEHRNNYLAGPRTRPMGAGLALFGLKKNSTEFPIEISLSPLKTDEGLLVLAAVRDISAQKLLEEELRAKNVELEAQNRRAQEANRLKSEFLANMSHELRTPLNGIIGFSELMYHEKVGPVSADHKEYLGDILSSSRHLLQLINDVLDLSKVEAGKMDFYYEKVNLAKITEETRDILRTMIAKKQIDLKMEIDQDIGEVVIDTAKFKQVLYNYVSNALKFTADGGQIDIRIFPEGKDFFCIEVKDNGIGIRKKDLNRLFVEFQQLDASIAKKYQGTGLGLALTRRIIEAQGGRVWVNSEFGKGSTFYATLPKKSVLLDQSHITKIVHTVSPSNSGKPTVLVIEDDLKDSALITDTLIRAGYAVEIAANGKEAVLLGQERKFDAITLDLLLPDINGWDILDALRSEGLNKETPVIAVTVVAEKEASFGFRIQDILTKPMKPERLLDALKRADIVPFKQKSVLVIDDNPHDLKLARIMLKKLGYRPISASGGEMGLQIAETELPDVIVLDLLMPGVDGFEFLRCFRKTKQGSNTPIIIWTAKDLTDAERSQLSSFAETVVLKGDRTTNVLIQELDRYLPLHSE